MKRELNPLVSIVIPVYKSEKYLKKSILSAFEQTYKNIEIILVDDGSPDKCPEICDHFASECSNISVIHKRNGGLSEARNVGIEQAEGEYLLFLDSDDILIKNAVEGLVRKAVESEADMVIPDRYFQIDEATKKASLRFHFNKDCFIENPAVFALEVMVGKGRAWRSSALLFKATLIKENVIRFPVNTLPEDIIFNLAVMTKARKLTFYEHSTLSYLKHAGSITASFQKNADRGYLLVDEKVSCFLRETNQDNEYGNNKRKELLCRNTITYISDVFSRKCSWDRAERYRRADDFLKNERVKEAFLVENISPYFDKMFVSQYFKIMFMLIKAGKQKSSYWIAGLVDKLNNRGHN